MPLIKRWLRQRNGEDVYFLGGLFFSDCAITGFAKPLAEKADLRMMQQNFSCRSVSPK